MRTHRLAASLCCVGLLAAATASAQTVVSTDVVVNTTWTGVIVLQRPIFVKSGARLTISAGTIVRGQPRSGPVTPGISAGSPGAVIVTRNGTIDVQGTATQPVIFTTAAVDNDADDVPDTLGGFYRPWAPGDLYYDDDPKLRPLAPLAASGSGNVALWGGIVILGNAPTNLADKCAVGFGVCGFPGLTVPGFPAADTLYGGLQPHDSSGRIRFASIRHAGDEIGLGHELAGLTLAAVGDATTIESVETYATFDDGIQWLGGTAGVKRVASFFAGDDALAADQGFSGASQFLFAVLPYFDDADGTPFGAASGDRLCELDGALLDNYAKRISHDEVTIDDTPFWPSGWHFWNMTLLGSSPNGALEHPVLPTSPNSGCRMADGATGFVLSSVILDTGVTKRPIEVTATGPLGFTACDNASAGHLGVACLSANNVATPPGGSCEATALSTGFAFMSRLFGGAGSASSINDGVSLVNEDPTLPLMGNDAGRLNAGLTPRIAKLNPRLVPGSFTAQCGQPRWQLGGLDPAATYRGAFQSAGNLWTTGWTALNVGGVLAD